MSTPTDRVLALLRPAPGSAEEKDVITRLPTEAEFRALEETVRASNLTSENADDNPQLGVICTVVAEFLARGIHERLPFAPKLAPDQLGAALALALAVGWSPVGRVCNQASFEKLARQYRVPVGDEADRPVVTSRTRTLCDVLAGFDAPGVESPFVDVYCLRAEEKPRADGPTPGTTAHADDEDDLDDEDPRSRRIEELIVVGRGLGETRKALQEICFSVGISLGGGALVTDGLIRVNRDGTAAIAGLIGDSGRTPGFLQGHADFAPDAMTFAHRELRELEKTSRFVRVHEIDNPTHEALIAERLKKFGKCPLGEAALMAPDPACDDPAAACLPVPSRKGRPRGWIPLAVVESPFFEEKIGVLEQVLLTRMLEGARRREKFHDDEVVGDREKLSDFAQRLVRFVRQLDHTRRAHIVAEAAAGRKRGLEGVGGDELPELIDRATRSLMGGDSAEEGDVRAFTAVCGLVVSQINGLLEAGTTDPELAKLAQSIRDELDEPCYLNVMVNHERGTKRAMAQPRKTNGQEFLGRIVPESIRLHLSWRRKMRHLRERIESAHASKGLRQWTIGVVLDLVLRNWTIDFGGQSGTGYDEFRRAARPLLLMAYARLLRQCGTDGPDALRTANLVFHWTLRARTDDPARLRDVMLVPHYFYDARYSALSYRKEAPLARLDDLTAYTEEVDLDPPRDPEAIRADFQVVIDRTAPEGVAGRLAVDFRTSPVQTLGALFDAARPGEKAAATPAVDLDGYFAILHTQHLIAAHAAPAALFLLTQAVRAGAEGRPPYDRANVLNQLPDIPWWCLQLVAVSLIHNQEPIPHSIRNHYQLIASWLQDRGGRYEPLPSNLPDAPNVSQLVTQCITLAEQWTPDFLKKMLSQPNVRHSDRLAQLMTAIAGGGFPPAPNAFVPHETGPQLPAADHVRAEYKRRRAEEARRLLPALVRLGRTARHAAEHGLDGIELYERMKDDLAKAFLLMGEGHSSQFHELVDEILNAQHAFHRA